MKKYMQEIIILCIQFLIFYLLPIFMYLIDPIAMVVLILLVTFILSFVLVNVSKNKIKYLYPLVTAILFLPSVFIFYNDSALIHSVWYFVVSFLGIGIGTLLKFVYDKVNKNKNISIKWYFLFIILLFMLSFGSVLFFVKRDYTSLNESSINGLNNGVSFSALDGFISETGAKFIMKNDSGFDIEYGSMYEIEMMKDDVWYELNVEISFNMVGYVLENGNSVDIIIDWGETYGKLSPGHYRAIKEISLNGDTFLVAAEFDVSS